MVARSRAPRPAPRLSTRPHRTHWARSTAAAAWALRWAALASIAAMRALAASLLDFPAHGEDAMDGPPPPPPAPRRNPVGGPPLTQPLAPLTQCKDLSFLTRAGGFGWEGKKKRNGRRKSWDGRFELPKTVMFPARKVCFILIQP